MLFLFSNFFEKGFVKNKNFNGNSAVFFIQFYIFWRLYVYPKILHLFYIKRETGSLLNSKNKSRNYILFESITIFIVIFKIE